MKSICPQIPLSCAYTLAVTIAICFSPNCVSAELSLLDESSSLEKIPTEFQLADGAAWDGRGKLFVPDVKAKRLLEFDLRKPESEPKVIHQGAAISGCFYQLGRLYVSDNGNSRIAVLADNGELATVAQFDNDQRPNDLTVDAHGTIYVTFTREGVVRRITPSDLRQPQSAKSQVDVVVGNLNRPNGIALTPDGSTFYVSSVKTGVISRILVDPTANEWPATGFARLEETPDGYRGDGMTVDRAGNVYCTGAEAVTVFDPAGQKIAYEKTPTRPINVILGGIEGRTLFVSTFGGLYQRKLNAYAVSPNPPKLSLQNATESTAVAASGITRDLNIVYASVDGRRLLMDVFTPSKQHKHLRPAIVVVHGGGWAKGDKTKFRELAVRLAKLGWVTASIEYRLAFEAKFPAAIRDCNAATSFLRRHADRWGIDPDRIGALGGSAGGHLVGLMASGQSDNRLRHSFVEESSRLKAAVVMAGPMQTATGSVAGRSRDKKANSNAVNWFGDTIEGVPEIYSLADAYEKIDGDTAPILFITGSLDNPDRNELSRKKLKQHGILTKLIVHPEAKHGHWNRPDWIAQVVSDIDSFFADQL